MVCLHAHCTRTTHFDDFAVLSFIHSSIGFVFVFESFFFFLSFSYDWIELTSADASSGNLVLPEKKMGW
jgi:hypothetical protein